MSGKHDTPDPFAESEYGNSGPAISDTRLNEMLAIWQTPPLPPYLKARTFARMTSARPTSTFFFAPRVQAATVGLALLTGLLVGIILPQPYAKVDTVKVIVALW